MTADETAEGFKRRLREAMEAAGVDQRQLAQRLGISESAVSKWFTSGQAPNLNALAAMPRALHVSLDWLVGVEGAAEPNGRKIAAAVEEALATARAALRAELLAAFDRWAERTPGRR